MNLGQLAFVCYVFDRTDNQRAYEHFVEMTNGHPNLFNPDHRVELLRFLNKWGCRHIATAHHELASQQIQDWYQEHGNGLPNENLWEIAEDDLILVDQAHTDLSVRLATHQKRFGATAAAKILFAIRPSTLVAWDRAIRESYVGRNGSYTEFLRLTIQELGGLHLNNGLENLPGILGYLNKTVPKLVDEYNWMTITRGFTPPDGQTLQHWVDWSD